MEPALCLQRAWTRTIRDGRDLLSPARGEKAVALAGCPAIVHAVPQPPAQPLEDDVRRPFRIVVDVLATAEQLPALQSLIGEALCAAPDEHSGPCRVAWSMAYTGGDEELLVGSYGMDVEEAAFIRGHLEPVAVWPRDEVDRSLNL